MQYIEFLIDCLDSSFNCVSEPIRLQSCWALVKAFWKPVLNAGRFNQQWPGCRRQLRIQRQHNPDDDDDANDADGNADDEAAELKISPVIAVSKLSVWSFPTDVFCAPHWVSEALFSNKASAGFKPMTSQFVNIWQSFLPLLNYPHKGYWGL